jgi:Tfp pilus assembly protein FimT
MRSRENGITLIGFLVVLIVVGFFAFMVMRLFPVYSEWYSVRSAMKGLANEAGIGRMGADQIRSRFERRLYTSYVESVKANNVRITTQGGPQIRVRYEVRRPLFGNLDFIATFDHTEKLSIAVD